MNGNKTYLVAGAAIILGIVKGMGVEIPGLEATEPGELVLAGMAAFGLRHGMQTGA